LKKIAVAYARVLQTSAASLQGDISGDDALEAVVRNAWSFLTGFGDPKLWKELELRITTVLEHKDSDPDLEALITETGRSLETLLTDPTSWDSVEERFEEARERFNSVRDSNLRDDISAFFNVLKRTAKSVLDDQDCKNIIDSTGNMMQILSPPGEFVNSDLVEDVLNVFVPALIKTIQTIPIPRLEISTPEIDLLLENILLTPGRTRNRTFLPFRFTVSTKNDLTVRTTHANTVTSSTTSQTTVTLSGLSIAATDVSFWLRAHAGLLRFADAGLLSLAVDERGADIAVTFSLHRNSPEHVVTLDRVRVRAHALRFSLRSSTFSLAAWLLRPLVAPLLRRTLERQVAGAVARGVRALDRELVFARERLRAARAAEAPDLWAFCRAVGARWRGGAGDGEEGQDAYVRVGVDEPGEGVFRGVYAPGSVVKMWRDEAEATGGWAERGAERGGWRNAVFDLGG
jgi:hypothetical protein